MAFEDLLKNYSVLNSSPWDRPPELPVPEPSALVNGPNYGPGIRRSLSQGMDLVEPDRKAARSRALDNIGPMLAFLPLMLAGTKNRKKGLAAFASAMANGITRERESQDALEVWRAEQLNSRKTREAAAIMEEIKEARSMMEKAAGLDPSLWGNAEFITAYQMGDITYLPRAGWKPPSKEERKSFQLAEIGGRKVVFDPATGEVVRDVGSARIPGTGVPKQENPVTVAEKAIFSYLMNGGDPARLKPVEQSIAMKKGWIPEERGDIKRTDKDAIYRYVRGGTDLFGNRTEGLANLTKNAPEQARQALAVRYGEGTPEYQYALSLLMEDPTSPHYPVGGAPAAAPKPAQTPTPSPITPGKFDAKAREILTQFNGDVSAAKAYIDGLSFRDEQNRAEALAALMRVAGTPPR